MVVDERRFVRGQLVQVGGVAEEGRPDLLRQLETDLLQARPQRRQTPRLGERRHRPGTVRVPRAGEHQIEGRGVPERAVGEHVAERPDDAVDVGPGIGAGDGQPVGGDAAFGETVVDQLEVLAGIDVDRAGGPRRRRLAGDQVVPFRRPVEELPAVVDAHLDARVAQRVFGGMDEVAHRDDVRGYLHHVDRLDAGQVQRRSDGDADAVADDQHLLHGAAVSEHGPIDEVAHVAQPGNRGPGHGEAVGYQSVVDGLLQPALLHQENGLGRSFANGDDLGPVRGVGPGDPPEVGVGHQAERKPDETDRQREAADGDHRRPQVGSPWAGAGHHRDADCPVSGGQHEEGGLHSEHGKQYEGGRERAAHRSRGVAHRQPAGGARCDPHVALQGVAEQREEDAGKQRRQQRQDRGQPEDSSP